MAASQPELNAYLTNKVIQEAFMVSLLQIKIPILITHQNGH